NHLHDHDSRQVGMAVKKLCANAGLQSTIPIAAFTGRAENRARVRELKSDLVPIEKLDWNAHAVIAMVDTQPGTGNNSLPADRNADVVIDHHPPRHDLGEVPWLDIRTQMGATATIVYEYLRDRRVAIGPPLATA